MIKVGRWYWTREGLAAWIAFEVPNSVLQHKFYGRLLCIDMETGSPYNPSYQDSWKENGRWGIDQDDEWDLICEPASRERIVFPDPATCPRWFKGSALEAERLRRVEAFQGESEEVLFT